MNRFPDFDELLIILGLSCIFVIPAVLCLFTIQKTLKKVAPHNQRIKPSYVWLALIPVVGTIYSFFLSIYISLSIRLELTERGIPDSQYPTLFPGLALSVIQLLSYFQFFKPFKGIAWFALLIIYWSHISYYKWKLSNSSPS